MPAGPDVSHGYADLGDVLLHYVTAGEGPPVVLLHGWPQTWWEWRHVIRRGSRSNTKSSPPTCAGWATAPARSPAMTRGRSPTTCGGVVAETLGHASFFLVGHDWGGPTAYALAAAHPEAVRGSSSSTW